ncbi:hypothetical protein R3I94_005073 [Phoxinus phoxinus]
MREHHLQNSTGEATPYPTVQMLGASNWKQVFSEKRVFNTVQMEGSEVCRAVGVEDGVLSAFCTYFVFNLAYPSYNRNTTLSPKACVEGNCTW